MQHLSISNLRDIFLARLESAAAAVEGKIYGKIENLAPQQAQHTLHYSSSTLSAPIPHSSLLITVDRIGWNGRRDDTNTTGTKNNALKHRKLHANGTQLSSWPLFPLVYLLPA